MKKVLILTGVLLLTGILLVAVPLSNRFSTIQYTKAMEMNALIAGDEDGWLHAQNGGVVTQVTGGNIGRVTRMLTLSQVQRAHFEKKLDAEITLEYSNGDVLYLASDPDAQDRVLIYQVTDGGPATFAIEGYQVMEAVRTAVSPEGFSGANTVMEGK